MQRRVYQLTERDIRNAEKKQVLRLSVLAEIEDHRDDKGYWKRRRTTYGLAKRDAAALVLQGDPEWHRGRGQAILDRLCGLDYADERETKGYNAGYYEGWCCSLNAMRDYVAANENFQEVMA